MKKGLRRLNKISYMSIILFLVISIGWYLDLGYEEYAGTILMIQIFTFLFSIGGLKQMIGIAGGSTLSDGIDIPGGGT